MSEREKRYFLLISYYKELKLPNNWVVSIDKVRINFVLYKEYAQEVINRIFNAIRPEVYNYPPNYQFAHYQRLCTINYGDDAIMSVGLSFNGESKKDKNDLLNDLKGYIEFNPNKIGADRQFLTDYELINQYSEVFNCPRIDLAIDVPFKREFILLKKDQRVYSSKVYSQSNKTEYLGLRNKIGRVKVYNKGLEAKIDRDVTRIEVTCEPNITSLLANFPIIYHLENCQIDLDFNNLPDTDKTILAMENHLLMYHLDDGLMLFDSLSYHKKQKLKQYLLPESALVGLTSVDVNLISKFLSERTEELRI